MAALIRCGRLLGRNLGQSMSKTLLPKEYKNSNLCLPLLYSVRSYANVVENKKLLPGNINRTIDNGYISRELYSSLLSSFEKKAKLTENNAVMLLYICCSGPFDVPLTQRLEMVEDIWSRLDEFGVEPSSKLYNMKLKAYIANKRNFSPLDELAAMKSLGLNPDKVTYGLLVEGFNQNGDVTGANYVLEAMKKASLNIGIATFNSFVTGHLKSGSIEDADNTIDIMRSRGLLPNTDTYFRYAEFYASEGDGDKVLEHIQKAQEEILPMDQSILMSLYHTMLLSGHVSEAEKIIPLLTEDFFQAKSMHRLSHLVSEGFTDEALQLYLTFPKMTTTKNAPNAGCFLLHSMIINGKDAESVVEMADKLLEANPSTTPHKYAVLYAYKYKNTDQALSILKLLSSKNYKLKMAHFIPAVCQYRNAVNVQGLYEAIGMLMDAELIDAQDFSMTMSSFCLPALTKLGQSRGDIVANMKEHEKQWNTLFLFEDLVNESCAVAFENAKNKDFDEQVLRYFRGRQKLFINRLPEEWEVCIKLLARLRKYDIFFHGFLSNLIMTVLEQVDKDTAEQVLSFVKKQKIRLHEDMISEKKINALPEDSQSMLQESFASQSNDRQRGFELISMKEMTSMSMEELEGYSKKYPNYKLARVALFKKHLEEKDLPAAQQKLRELDVSGFTFPRHELISFIPRLVDLGDVESAVLYMKSLNEVCGTNYPDSIPLKIAIALLKTGNVQEALSMIQCASESQMPMIPAKERLRKRMLTDLLLHAPTVQDAESIHKSLMDTDAFLSQSDKMLLHRQYMKKVLESDIDDEDLLRILEKFNEDYWVFPCMDQIITRFIEKQKKSYLKRVIDLGVNIVGSNLFYHKLAFNLVGCGMPTKASSILQSLKDNINEKATIKSCQYFVKNKEVDCVESLVDITKTLPIKRGVMLAQLIEAYVSVDDVEKAIDVLQKFLDEGVTPPKSTLDFMSGALKTRNLDAPQVLNTLIAQRLEVQETATENQERLPPSDSSSLSNSQATDEEDMTRSESESHKDVHLSLSKTDDVSENHKS